jgi:nitroimidazol reductase NimA-like FMN-containing flavoprotein (pyridoxamine 5'-phosphate oxidase superfamily)
MSRSTARRLDEDAIDTFLESQSTGTLSLAKENDSYAIPVAYTFDPEDRNIYFRLGYAPGSRKREFIDATEQGTFVVAADTAEGWQSVVARGTLGHINTVEDLSRHSLPGESTSPADRELRIPFYHVFEAPSETVFALVRLEVRELTGVAEASDD